MPEAHSTAVSSPGKVLVAGGYLVVDRKYTGLVFGLSARIHAHIHDEPSKAKPGSVSIVVRSPQFDSASWKYTCTAGDPKGSAITVKQDKDFSSPRNKFVETVIQYALTYISHVIPFTSISPATVTILADTAYYSHASTATPNPNASAASPFLNFNVSLTDAHKTGLGSSAALVTSLTSALLTHYLGTSSSPPPPTPQSIDLTTADGKRRAHNLSQLAHCSAQGKVGSGFDVAAAVYGAFRYRRFSPSVLEFLSSGSGSSSSSSSISGSNDSATFSAERLTTLVNDDAGVPLWDTEVKTSSATTAGGLEGGLCLLMADVDCGSETPGMVKKMFAWRDRDRAHADAVWNELQRHNDELASLLLLPLLPPSSSTEKGEGKQAQDSHERETRITQTLASCRRLMREMGAASGVPVEPPAQTALLDACSAVDGVLGGLVPGAGGYDAVVLVARDDPATRARVKAFLDAYDPSSSNSSSDGEPRVSKVSLLDVTQAKEGVRLEDPTSYVGWI